MMGTGFEDLEPQAKQLPNKLQGLRKNRTKITGKRRKVLVLRGKNSVTQ